MSIQYPSELASLACTLHTCQTYWVPNTHSRKMRIAWQSTMHTKVRNKGQTRHRVTTLPKCFHVLRPFDQFESKVQHLYVPLWQPLQTRVAVDLTTESPMPKLSTKLLWQLHRTPKISFTVPDVCTKQPFHFCELVCVQQVPLIVGLGFCRAK